MSDYKNGKKPEQYFNFGSGWDTENPGTVNCGVDWKRNSKANNGQAYKLFLVPVDESGDVIEGGEVEVTKFKIRLKEHDAKTPPGAPNYQIYTWK